MSFYLDANNWAFACLLVNVSNLSDTVLTYSECILGYLWSFLASDESTRNTDKNFYLVAVGIGSTCVKNTHINSIYITSAWIRFISIKGTSIRGICVKKIFIKGVQP